MRILLILLAAVLLLGCTPSNLVENTQTTEGPVIEEPPATDIIPEQNINNSETTSANAIREEPKILVTYRVGSPGILIALPGFENSYESPGSLLEKKKESMTVTIFAEKILTADSSADCREYYQPSIERFIAEMYRRRSELHITKISDIELEDRNNISITNYEVTFKFSEDMVGTHKSLNAYVHTPGYCWDIHISDGLYNGSRAPFDEIIDSIEVTDAG